MRTSFNIKKGRSRSQTFTLEDDGGALDLTDVTSATIKIKSQDGSTTLVSTSLTILDPTVAANRGKVKLAWQASWTSSATIGKYYGEMALTYSDGGVLYLPETDEIYLLFNLLPSLY